MRPHPSQPDRPASQHRGQQPQQQQRPPPSQQAPTRAVHVPEDYGEGDYQFAGFPSTASMPNLDGFLTAWGPPYGPAHSAWIHQYHIADQHAQVLHADANPPSGAPLYDQSDVVAAGSWPAAGELPLALPSSGAVTGAFGGQALPYLAMLPAHEFRPQPQHLHPQPTAHHHIVPFVDDTWQESPAVLLPFPGQALQNPHQPLPNPPVSAFDVFNSDISLNWSPHGASRFRPGQPQPQLPRPPGPEASGGISVKSVSKEKRPKKSRHDSALTAKPQPPGRRGPLTQAQRDKADDTRYYGACWRCRRYKKPCNGTTGICETCSTSGFRVWPSSLGCRRGDLESFVRLVVPKHAEEAWKDMVFDHPRPNRSWRTMIGFVPQATSIPISRYNDRWDQLSLKVQATQLFGVELIELIQIAARYQRTRDKQDPIMNAACTALSCACDFYHMFVATEYHVPTDTATVLSTLSTLRTALSAMWRLFLNCCLAGRRASWFPAFISSCINACVLVVLMDGAMVVPPPQRALLWPNIMSVIMQMRQSGYAVNIDLLSILAKGAKPLAFNCWTTRTTGVCASGWPRVERNEEGLKLVGGDVGAFDGMAALQAWLKRYGGLMKDGKLHMVITPQMKADIMPISVIFRMVEAATGSDAASSQRSGSDASNASSAGASSGSVSSG